MKLLEADCDLFFKLMWRLQLYVNRKLKLLPAVQSVEAYSALPHTEVAKVRNELWGDPRLVAAYLTENPDALSPDELSIVEKWKRSVSGTFYIARFLKKHAVFISEDNKVYGVLALSEPMEEMVLGRPLPVMVQAVLLPFKGKIVHDGILSLYNITFGGGIRRRLDETYMTAKQRGLIVEALEPEASPRPDRIGSVKAKRDLRPVLDDIVERAEKLKGGTALERAAFGVLVASARLARDAAYHPEDALELAGASRQASGALSRFWTVAERATTD